MSNRMFYTLVALISIGIAIIVGTTAYFALNQSSTDAQEPPCRTFPETGKTVCFGFLKYWTEHGGLSRQGFPISNEFQEVSDIDGKTYTAQYFERSVFEYHPENQPPYDVLLSLLGTIEFRKYPTGVPELKSLPPGMKPEGGAFFQQTGKEVRGIFLAYWEANGGPLQLGYPISNAFVERSRVDGKERVVQYFERSVLEYHPENQPPHDIQVALLGRFQFERKYPKGEPSLLTSMPGQSPTAREPRPSPTPP